MIISLQSADGAVISVEHSLLTGSGYITSAVEDLNGEATSKIFDVPCAKRTQPSFSLEHAEAEVRSEFPPLQGDTDGSMQLR